MLIFLRVTYVLICAGAAVALVQNPMAPEFIRRYSALSFILMMLLTQIVTFIDILFPRKRLDVISAIYFGLLVGWLLAFQLQYAAQAFMTSIGVGVQRDAEGNNITGDNPYARVIGDGGDHAALHVYFIPAADERRLPLCDSVCRVRQRD